MWGERTNCIFTLLCVTFLGMTTYCESILVKVMLFGLLLSWFYSRRSTQVAPKPVIIAIEGNIGSGKSTVIHNLRQSMKNVVTLQEPTLEWENFCGHNMLDLFYSNPTQYAFAVQVYLQSSLFKQFTNLMTQHRTENIILMERSMMSSKEFFIPLMKSKSYITDIEASVTSYLCEAFSQATPVQLTIYLRSQPTVCMERIRQRGRPEEVDRIDIDYLQELHNKHEQWRERCDPVVIDVERKCEKEVAQCAYLEIMKFVKKRQ